MARTNVPNCDEFYIKPHPQPEKTMCTATTFHIISEMLSRVYNKGSYKISIGRFNELFGYKTGLGVEIDTLKAKFDHTYKGGLLIKEVQGTYMENPMPSIYKNYVLNCITYPIVNIDLVEVCRLIENGVIDWNVSLNYARINPDYNRIDYHAVILIKYDEKSNEVYLYDPMDVSVPNDVIISNKSGLEYIQKIDVNSFLNIWKYNPYDNIKVLPDDMWKNLIIRLAWLLMPKKVSLTIKKHKKQTILDVWGE